MGSPSYFMFVSCETFIHIKSLKTQKGKQKPEITLILDMNNLIDVIYSIRGIELGEHAHHMNIS